MRTIVTTILCFLLVTVSSFVPSPTFKPSSRATIDTKLRAEGDVAQLVNGEILEKMLAEMDSPVVIDAYATWCGPCVLMAPMFEAAAKEMKEKGVKFVKLDTDMDEDMAARLNIMGLPTLLFLDKHEPEEGSSEPQAAAVLKGRIEGAIKKESIVELCNHYFFGAPAPAALV